MTNKTNKHLQMLDRMHDALGIINCAFDWYGVSDRVKVQTHIWADTVGDIVISVPELDNIVEYRVNVSDYSDAAFSAETLHDIVMRDARQVAADVIAWVRDECDGEKSIAMPQTYDAEAKFYSDVCSLIGARDAGGNVLATRWQAVADFLVEEMGTRERIDALGRLARFYGIQTIDTSDFKER